MMNSCNCRCKGKRGGILLSLWIAIAVAVSLAGCGSMPKSSGMMDSKELPSERADAQAQTPAPETDKQGSGSPFPTFKETGLDPCVDNQGRPLIILFSAASCPHCQWVGGVFDFIARQYADQGLVAVHHYDIETGDDLLTEAVETRIPAEHLSIGRSGDPDGHLPYFNFGCRYDRIGTGYEEQNDLAAEAEEICQVIESLLP